MSLSLSLRRDGWERTLETRLGKNIILNNEGLSSFAEMGDYNVEAKWTMAE